MRKCVNEDSRDLFIHFTSTIGSLTTRGVGETQLNQLDARTVGTPLFISFVNCPMDMWGPKFLHTNKLIELKTLHYGVIMELMNHYYNVDYYRDPQP